jgi:internalin A
LIKRTRRASEPNAEVLLRIAQAEEQHSIQLDLSGLHLETLPEEVCRLPWLRSLNLGSNDLRHLEDEIASISALEELFLNDNPLRQVPEAIYHLTGLHVLDLSTTGLESLSPKIGGLSQLRRLDLDNNALTRVPSSLGKLTDLRVVWLDHNRLRELPNSLGGLQNIRILGLNGNPLRRDIAAAYSLGLNNLLGYLRTQSGSSGTELHGAHSGRGTGVARQRIHEARQAGRTTLDLSDLQLRGIPREIRELKNLRTLHISGNRISDISLLCELSLLETLDLSFNALKTLPLEIGRLSNLQHLWLNNNQLQQIPPEIGSLTNLKSLWLSSNKLSRIPSQVGNLNTLESLDLSKMAITELPQELGNLRHLQRLDLDSNSLTNIPAELSRLKNLKILFLDYNDLNEIPNEIALIPGLRTLSINGNPLPLAIRAAYSQGYDVLLEYMRSLVREVTNEIYEIKVVLLGEGRAGKTCLVDSLLGMPFVHHAATHGALRNTLRTTHPSVAGRIIQLHFWDFGGQEAYQAAHALFFSPRALFILVWDVRAGADQGRVRSWLDRVQTRLGFEAQVVLVGTHSRDFSGPSLDFDSLRQDYGRDFVQEMYTIDNYADSTNGRVGISQLLSGLVDDAAALIGPGDRLNVAWSAVRTRLANTEALQISYADYEAICREEAMSPDEGHALARLLHALGDILYFADDPALRDLLVLKPDWPITAIDYVLADPLLRDTGGVLPVDSLLNIWETRPMSEGVTYFPRWSHAYLLRLMELLDICYRVVPESGDISNAREIVVPLRLPAKRPKSIPWKHGPEGSIVRVWHSDRILPETILPKIISRTNRPNASTHWKAGTFVTDERHDAEALIEKTDSFSITLSIRGSSRQWLSSLAETVDTVLREWPDLAPRRLIGCPRCIEEGHWPPGEFRLDLVVRQHDELVSRRRVGYPIRLNEETMQCSGDHGCGARVSVAELITGIPYRLSAASREEYGTARGGGEVADAVSELRYTSNRIDAAVSMFEARSWQATSVIKEASRRLEQLSEDADLLATASQVSARSSQAAAALAGEATEQLRQVLAELGDQGRDGPRLFTVLPTAQASWLKVRDPRANEYQVVLWCEYPGGFHPVAEASYAVRVPTDWWTNTAPYLRLMSKGLKLAVPILGALPELLLDAAAIQHIRADLEATQAVVEELSTLDPNSHLHGAVDEIDAAGDLSGDPSLAEGSALAAFHSLLRSADPDGLRWHRALRRAYIPAQGTMAWLCMTHWPEFSRPLPNL